MSSLFVYGTLMCEEMLVHLLHRVPLRHRALLCEFKRSELARRPYPGLTPAAGARACGFLLSDLTVAEMRTLDEYEGDGEYERREVMVDLLVDSSPLAASENFIEGSEADACATFAARGPTSRVPAFAYVWNTADPSLAADVLPTPWSFDAWKRIKNR